MNSTEFSGKTAFVTGAGSGIGAATATLLARRGAAVAVLGRRKGELHDVVASIREAGGRALAVPGDVGEPSDVERAVDTAVAEFGALHGGVNNADMSGYLEGVADPNAEYSSARHAIRGLTGTIAMDYADRSIPLGRVGAARKVATAS